MKLRDYCIYKKKGLNYSNSWNSNIDVDFYEIGTRERNNGWYYLTMSCIKAGLIEKAFPINGNREFLKYSLQDGDIIICKLGPYFRTAIFDSRLYGFKKQSEIQILITENMYILSVDKDKIDPYYIAYMLEKNETKKYFTDIAKGNKTRVLNIEDVLEYDIPDYDEQMKEATSNYQRYLYQMLSEYKKLRETELSTAKTKLDASIDMLSHMFNDSIQQSNFNMLRESLGRIGYFINNYESRAKKYLEEMDKELRNVNLQGG